MKYCKKCGARQDDDALFCSVCGAKLSEEEKREEIVKPKVEVVKEGSIHKCPYCGEFLPYNAFKCPSCGHEIRDREVSSTVSIFYEHYLKATLDNQKIELIKTFPVPNTKEDISEFMIIASSNFDVGHYITHKNEETSDSAWLAKMEQCYQKCISSPNRNEFAQVIETYEKLLAKIASGRKKKKYLIILGLIITVIGGVGTIVFASLRPQDASDTSTNNNIMLVFIGVLAIGIILLVFGFRKKLNAKEKEERDAYLKQKQQEKLDKKRRR